MKNLFTKPALVSVAFFALTISPSGFAAENYFADCQDATQTLQNFIVSHCKSAMTTTVRSSLYDVRKNDPTTESWQARHEDDFNSYEWDGVIDRLQTDSDFSGQSIGCQSGPDVLPLDTAAMSFDVASCQATDSLHKIHYKVTTLPYSKVAKLTAYKTAENGQAQKATEFDQSFSFIDESRAYHIVQGFQATVRDPGRGCQWSKAQNQYFIPMQEIVVYQVYLLADMAKEPSRFFESFGDGDKFGTSQTLSQRLINELLSVAKNGPISEEYRQAACKINAK